MSNNRQNILDEEFKLLIRATRNELFHFIAVQYNHYDLVRKVKKDLAAHYPNRPVHSFNLDNCNPDTIIHDILDSKSGLVFIEKFDLIFTEPFRSLCIGFNQRRDLFSTFPIQIIVFISSGEENLQNFQKAMPDVFSIVNPMIQLVQEIEKVESEMKGFERNEYGFANVEEAKSEVDRIEKRLKSLVNTAENARLIVSLKINLAQSYHFVGEYLKSKLLLEELLVELHLSNKNLDFENEIAIVENDLALVLRDLGNYEEAKKLLEKSTIFAEINFGGKHPTTAVSYSNLAAVLKDLGDYERAKTFLEKAMISDETNFGEKHPTTAVRYSNLALVLQDLGDYEGAKKLLEKATISAETNFGGKHPTTAVRYSNLALVLQDLGDYQNAIILLEKAYKIYNNHLGENHPKTKTIKENLDYVKERMK
jgi:tetratricopeptide (TPR) repeat protein